MAKGDNLKLKPIVRAIAIVGNERKLSWRELRRLLTAFSALGKSLRWAINDSEGEQRLSVRRQMLDDLQDAAQSVRDRIPHVDALLYATDRHLYERAMTSLGALTGLVTLLQHASAGLRRKGAKPQGDMISAQVCCASIVGAAWEVCRGEWPGKDNKAAQSVCRDLWIVCGGKPGYGEERTASGWRKTLNEARQRRNKNHPYSAMVRRWLSDVRIAEPASRRPITNAMRELLYDHPRSVERRRGVLESRIQTLESSTATEDS